MRRLRLRSAAVAGTAAGVVVAASMVAEAAVGFTAAAVVGAGSTEADLLEVIAAERLVARTAVDRRAARLAG